MALRPNSRPQVEEYRFNGAGQGGGMILNLLRGGMRATTGLIGKARPESVAIKTPVATIGIRGTHFGAQFCQETDYDALRNLNGNPLEPGLYVDVAEGAVQLHNPAGTLDMATGQRSRSPAQTINQCLLNETHDAECTIPPTQ